jgi:hypothetical protein
MGKLHIIYPENYQERISAVVVEYVNQKLGGVKAK